MSLLLDDISRHPGPAAVRGTPEPSRPRRARVSPAEWVVIGVFACFSLALFAVDTLSAAADGRVFIGAASPTPDDTLQYLAWATDAAHHGLIANLFGFHNGGHVFLHPIWLLTGLLHVDAGMSYPLLLALWQCATLGVLLVALRRLATVCFPHSGRRRAVMLALALLFASPFFVLAVNLNLAVPLAQSIWLLTLEGVGTTWVGGDFPMGLTIAAMVIYVLLLGRAGSSERSWRELWLLGGLGAIVAWLHPWQGAELAAMTVGLVAWSPRRWRRHLPLLVPLVLTTVPLLYFEALPSIDLGWRISNANSIAGWANPSLLAALPVFGPLVLIMAPGYLTSARDDLGRLLRLWPAAVAITYVLTPTAKFHAFAGITVPAAILAIEGWPTARRLWRRAGGREAWARRLPGIVLALLIVGSAGVVENELATHASGSRGDSVLQRPSAEALAFLAGRPRGGVLSTPRIGLWTPALTDDPTWVGHFVWTPDWVTRSIDVEWLFGDARARVTPASARRFVLRTGARYVVQPCGSRTDLVAALTPAGFTTRRFGCVTVFSAPTPSVRAAP